MEWMGFKAMGLISALRYARCLPAARLLEAGALLMLAAV
jgi:hypothetical protein